MELANVSILGFTLFAGAFNFSLLQQPPCLLVGLLRLPLRIRSLKRLQLGVIVICNTQKRQKVAKQIDGRHGVLDHRPRERDQKPILYHTGDIHGERGGLTHQQEHGQIQGERAERIGTEDHEIQMETGGVPQQRVLHYHPRHGQERKTTRRDIEKRSDGVQANTSGIQQNLDQNQPGGLEYDGQKLQHDAPSVKLGLAIGGDADAEGDGDHVEHGVGLEGVLLEGEAEGVDSDGHESLEHLDEGNGEVDVRGVGEPEGERVKGADGDDGLDVEVTGHGGRLLHNLKDADEEVGEGGAEGHVDHGKRDREGPVVEFAVQDVLVVHDHREAQTDPDQYVEVGEQNVSHNTIGESHFFGDLKTLTLTYEKDKENEDKKLRER
ncbi:hypothetical protein F2P56_002749 [Juglans regia]|uniref:Uncharacterized protein n=1 Tax=Juglans regia TaxID=51240 RepID=A0A833YAT6_JUGRE|nr:hypothetical protein F2P56_002749 [Juglans regia]